jgi:hypothetical protein
MDHILYWNSVALEANKRDFSNVPGEDKPRPEQGGPTRSSRALAIIHLAMYDAHAGAVNNPLALPRYLAAPPSPVGGANAAAAVAAAAHACLSALYPRQKHHFDAALSAAPLAGAGLAAGSDFGLQVAKAILIDRGGDPTASDAGYCSSLNPTYHRPDPEQPGQGFHAPFYGAGSKCFAVSQRHGLSNPRTALTAVEHAQAVQQVRGMGIAPELMGTVPAGYGKRTVDQTLLGIYWAYDGARDLGTPPRLYNQIVREIAMSTINPITGAVNTVDDNARLFAFVNAAMGDAGILAWEQKYIHDYWRPVVGIREHHGSMGPMPTAPGGAIGPDCDPMWLPLGKPSSNSKDKNGTPDFPAYPSGHATFGAAAFQIVRLFYLGDAAKNLQADQVYKGPFVSDELNGRTTDNTGTIRPRHNRSFDRGLLQMIEENGFSRVWLGVHWVFDAFALQSDGETPDLSRDKDGNFIRNIGGVPLGLKIAEDIFSAGHCVAPVKSSVGPCLK